MSSFNLDNFNDLIKNANSIISCGPDCVKEKTAAELKQEYETAQYNKNNSQYNVSTAAKNYITFTQGQSGYNDYLDQELSKKADTISNNYNTNFTNNINIIKNNINTFKSLFLNANNVSDLYEKYKHENDILENSLKNKSADIITNDRKTYYEEEGISKLDNYYKFFLWIYFFVVFIFLLSIIFVDTDVKLYTRILIFIVLVIYPFIIMFVFNFIKNVVNRIKDYIPSNAYRNI